MAFPAHGTANITCTNQIIIANIEGPWNLELIELYRREMKPTIDQLTLKGPWGLIVNIHRSAICPPDAIDLIKQGVKADVTHNRRISTCYVIQSDVEGRRLMDPIWRSIYVDIMPFEIFTTLDEAMSWTRQQLCQSV